MRGILLIRHGNTTYDKKVDALLDPPLSKEGVDRIGRTVKFLDSQNFTYNRIISSPRQRALKVAEMLSRGNLRVTTSNGCLPWNLGDLMGRPNTEAKPAIELLKDYPDLKAPHGEAYRTFYERWTAVLQKLMDYAESHEDYVVVTTHSRNIDALQEYIGGLPIGDFEPLTPEASVTLLAKNGVSWDYKLIWDGR